MVRDLNRCEWTPYLSAGRVVGAEIRTGFSVDAHVRAATPAGPYLPRQILRPDAAASF
jgi:hypothetical protein